jgi:hypothetical protein
MALTMLINRHLYPEYLSLLTPRNSFGRLHRLSRWKFTYKAKVDNISYFSWNFADIVNLQVINNEPPTEAKNTDRLYSTTEVVRLMECLTLYDTAVREIFKTMSMISIDTNNYTDYLEMGDEILTPEFEKQSQYVTLLSNKSIAKCEGKKSVKICNTACHPMSKRYEQPICEFKYCIYSTGVLRYEQNKKDSNPLLDQIRTLLHTFVEK